MIEVRAELLAACKRRLVVAGEGLFEPAPNWEADIWLNIGHSVLQLPPGVE